MRENDWLVATINNPTFTNQDFKDVFGMDMTNTQILPYQSYLSSPFITQNDIFKDDNGNFSESKFKDFYKNALNSFSEFSSADIGTDNFEYSIFDPKQKADSKIKDPHFRMNIISNPDRISTGISGRNQRESSPFSQRELAQQSKIFDTATGKYLEYSPNDMALTESPIKWIESLFSDPIVAATWDSEGEHKNPITGQIEHHVKGQAKLNDEGQYYYETLNGRSPLNKDILSSTDILTVDGEGLNKYDFLDSDGLDKSAAGTISKMALAIAPLFFNRTRAIYSGALIAREMAKSLPMLYGMVTSLFGVDSDSSLLNTAAAYGDKFTTNTSDYSKQNTFTLENIGSLMGDVALQWSQQKLIAKSISNLKGSNKALAEAQKSAAKWYEQEANKIITKAASNPEDLNALAALKYISSKSDTWAESALGRAAITKFVRPAEELIQKNMRLGADASLAYMAIISNTHVYSSMLQHGTSKRDAALVAFGSTLGMFGVDRYLHLGELFFDELSKDTALAAKYAIRNEAKNLAQEYAEQSIKDTAKEKGISKVGSLIMKGINFGKSVIGKYADDLANHTTGFFGKAFGEGLEEVTEELVTDLSEQLYQIAGEFGPNVINTTGITNVGAWDNMAARYGMSFLGGTLGGGLFYGVDVASNGKFIRDTTKDELIYLVSNGKTKELYKELNKQRDKGFGSKNLSASKYETNENGEAIYLTAEDETDSQNEAIYNRIKESIQQIDGMLNSQGTKLSDDALFEQMVLKEQRFLDLRDMIKDASYTTRYYQEFRRMQRELYDAEQNLKTAYNTVEGTIDGTPLQDSARSSVKDNPVRQENLNKLESEVNRLKAERDGFLKGNYSLEYTEKMLFALDSYLNLPFTSTTFESWVKNNKNKDVADLTDAEKETFKKEYLEYKKIKQAEDLTQAFNLYKQIKQQVDPHIKNLQDKAPYFRSNSEKIRWLLSADGPIAKLSQLTYEDKLEGESDEDYESRNTQQEGESNEDYTNRRVNRAKQIAQYNEEQYVNLKNTILQTIDETGGYIDPSTLRQIQLALNISESDVQKSIVKQFQNKLIQTGLSLYIDIAETLNALHPDLSNLSDIQESLKQNQRDRISENYEKAYTIDANVLQYITKILNDVKYTPNNLVESFINDIRSKSAQSLLNMYDLDIDQINNLTDDQIREQLNNTLKDVFNSYMQLKGISSTELLQLISYIAKGIKEGDSAIKEWFIKNQQEPAYNKLVTLEEPEILQELLANSSPLLVNKTASVWLEDNEAARLATILDNITSPIHIGLSSSEVPYIMEDLGLETSEQIINREIQEELNIDELLNQLRANMEGDVTLSLYKTLKEKLFSYNPVIDLVKSVKVLQGKEEQSLESLLTKIHQRFNENSTEDFTLTNEELDILGKAAKTLQLMRTYIYAAGTDQSYDHPVGHNKVINEMANNHRDIYPNFQELPTLDQDVANMYILEINKFLNEIVPESPTSWANLSFRNQINKTRKLLIADTKFTEAKLQFLDVLKGVHDTLKFKYNDKQYDLLDGIELISDTDPNIKLHKIENLLYINLHKIINEGISFKTILKESGLLSTLLNLNKVIEQITTTLDETIDYGKLTDFDKFTYLLTIFGISSNEFYNFIDSKLKDTENNLDNKQKAIVPITIQEYTSRTAIAQVKNPILIQEALEYIAEETNTKKPILSNFYFVDGSAGVGKSRVIAKNVVDYLNTDNIWLVAPEKTQRDTLKEIVQQGEPMLIKDLFAKILPADYYNTLKSDTSSLEAIHNRPDITIVADNITDAAILNLDNVKFNEVEDLPKAIIIDEGTYVNGLEYQLLTKFASDNGIEIIVLGDTNQNGIQDNIGPLTSYNALYMRSPKLSISLRDVNLQKYKNLQKVTSLLQLLENTPENTPAAQQLTTNISKLIKDISFEVYNQEVIEGDLITSSITPEQVKKLRGKIGFIGDISGITYKTLVDNITEDSSLTALSVKEIQGQEFDYVISDIDWKSFKLNDPIGDSFIFLRNLYTVISRGRHGSILIDNGLTELIGNNINSTNRALAPNLQNAIKPFVTNKRAVINSLNLIPNESFEKLIIPEQPATQQESGESSTPRENVAVEDDSQESVPNDDTNLQEALKSANLIENTPTQDEDNFTKFIEENSKESCRFYGATSISGLAVSKENRNGTEINIWRVPQSTSIKQDLQIFLSDSTKIIESGEDKDLLVRKLLSLKSYFLYKGEGELSSEITNIVSEQNLKEASFELEVRTKQDTDNLVGFSGLSADKLPINGLIYSIVAKFKNNNGEDCKVTLGTLANPDSWIIPNNPNQDIVNTITSNKQQYTTIINTLKQRHQEKGDFSISIKPTFSGLTNLRRYTSSNGTRTKVQTVTLEEFRSRHPYSIISKPYILIAESIPGISDQAMQKIRGKGVVFVTNNLNANPDTLQEYYIQSKRDTLRTSAGKSPFDLNITPQVRMFILESVGLFFNDLANHNTLSKYSSEKSKWPFETDYTGIRMFISMWNYRANLDNFLKAYEAFRDSKGWSDEDIRRITKVESYNYRKSQGESAADITETATSEELSALKAFNSNAQLGNLARQFRLGYSDNDGCYIRTLDVDAENSFYKGVTNPKGIYLSYNLAQKQFDLINDIFTNILDKIIPVKLSTGENFPTNKVITSKEGFSNSIKGLVDSVQNSEPITIENESGKYTLSFPSKKSFKSIPTLLTILTMRVRQFQDQDIPDSIYIGSKEDRITFDSSFISKQLAPTFQDTRFIDMMNLIFHGATTPKEKNRATDAYFKQGFFSDPMGVAVSGQQTLFKKAITNEKLFSINAEVDMPIGYINLTSLQEAVDNSSQSVQEKTPTEIFLDTIHSMGVSSKLKTTKAINNSLNTSRKKVFNQHLDNSIESFLNSPHEVSVENQQITTVREVIEKETGLSLEGASYNWNTQGNSPVIEIDINGNKIKLSLNIKGTLKIDKIISIVNPVKDITQQVKDILTELLASESIEDYASEAFKTVITAYTESNNITPDTLNNIIKKLNDNINDETSDDITTALDQLNKLYKDNCSV